MESESNDSVSTVSKPRNRQVSSRFMSPSPTSTAPPEPGSSADSRHHHRSLEDSTFSRGQHWASSAKRISGTLADHIGNDRLREHVDREKSTKTTRFVLPLSKQRSCRESELKSFEKDRNNNNNNNGFKENDQPIIGGSMRYTGKVSFPGKSSTSCVKKPNSNSNDSDIVPGRLSFDENALYKKSLSSRRNSDFSTNSVDSESDCFNSPTTTSSSRKLGRVVSSKYMSDGARRAQRGTSDSDISNPLSSDDSSMMKKFTIPKVIKRANSLIGYKSSKSQWALSPGRSGSPSISVESKEKPFSFSSLRPPNKSVEKILSMGFDLFRTRKSSSSSSSSCSSSPMGFGNSEAVHKLRLLDNRLIQWRFANARAQAVNENISHHAQSNLIYALDGLAKLQHSVLQKKIYSLREKLEMKLNFVLHSQMKPLETWGGMERQHLAAVIVMKECLQSVVSKVPLLEGAKVDIQSASVAQRHASDLTASIKSVLTSFSPAADKTAELISELAAIVAQEKLLLQEFFDLFRTICVLELKERSLKCSLIQLKC